MQPPLTTFANNIAPIPIPAGRADFIRLDLNESNGFWDDTMIKSAFHPDPFFFETYPDYTRLNQALEQYTKMPIDHLSITNGSDHAIELLLRLFFTSGDKIVLPEPTFFVYNHMLTQSKIDYISIPYTESATEFTFPLTEVLEALDTSVKGLLLCNPANPTGSVIPPTDIELLLEKTHELAIPVIIDEAYFEYYGHSAVSYLKKYSHIVVLRTLSKGFGLAGIRFGYVIANPAVIEELRKLQLPWSVSHPATQIATYCLEHNDEFIVKRESLLNRKLHFQEVIESLGISTYESAGNFFLANVSEPEKFCDAMRDEGVLFGRAYKAGTRIPALKNTVRFGIPGADQMNTVVDRIKKVAMT